MKKNYQNKAVFFIKKNTLLKLNKKSKQTNFTIYKYHFL